MGEVDLEGARADQVEAMFRRGAGSGVHDARLSGYAVTRRWMGVEAESAGTGRQTPQQVRQAHGGATCGTAPLSWAAARLHTAGQSDDSPRRCRIPRSVRRAPPSGCGPDRVFLYDPRTPDAAAVEHAVGQHLTDPSRADAEAFGRFARAHQPHSS